MNTGDNINFVVNGARLSGVVVWVGSSKLSVKTSDGKVHIIAKP